MTLIPGFGTPSSLPDNPVIFSASQGQSAPSPLNATPSFDQAVFGIIPGGNSLLPPNGEPASLNQVASRALGLLSSILQLLLGKSANLTPIDLNSNPVIAQNLDSLVGNNPAAMDLVGQLVTTDPDSPQTKQLTQQLVETMQQSGYSGGDIKKTNILIAAMRLNKVEGTLQAIGGNLQPGSAEAQQIQARLNSLQQIKATLSQEFAQAN